MNFRKLNKGSLRVHPINEAKAEQKSKLKTEEKKTED